MGFRTPMRLRRISQPANPPQPAGGACVACGEGGGSAAFICQVFFRLLYSCPRIEREYAIGGREETLGLAGTGEDTDDGAENRRGEVMSGDEGFGGGGKGEMI